VYQNGPSWVSTLFSSLGSFITVGYIINGPFLILVVIAILFWKKEDKEEGFLSVIRYLGAKTFPFLRYLISFCFYSTSFFALTADTLSIALFLLASFASLIKNSLLLNFTLRKD